MGIKQLILWYCVYNRNTYLSGKAAGFFSCCSVFYKVHIGGAKGKAPAGFCALDAILEALTVLLQAAGLAAVATFAVLLR